MLHKFLNLAPVWEHLQTTFDQINTYSFDLFKKILLKYSSTYCDNLISFWMDDVNVEIFNLMATFLLLTYVVIYNSFLQRIPFTTFRFNFLMPRSAEEYFLCFCYKYFFFPRCNINFSKKTSEFWILKVYQHIHFYQY